MPLPGSAPGEVLQGGGLALHALSPYALRWIAVAGAAGAFVVGLSAQAVRGHADTTPHASSARLRAAIADSPGVAARRAPSLRAVTVPSLRNAPQPPARKAPSSPAPATLVSATPAPAAGPTPSAAPSPAVRTPAAPPVKAPPTAKPPARGPGFDSSG